MQNFLSLCMTKTWKNADQKPRDSSHFAHKILAIIASIYLSLNSILIFLHPITTFQYYFREGMPEYW